MEYEVVWSGGELLPPREEGTSPFWRNMLTDTEAGLFSRVMGAATRRQMLIAGELIHTGRFCLCGCGQEMTYRPGTKTRDQQTQFKPGHTHRRKDMPERECYARHCNRMFTPTGTFSRYCSKPCQFREQRARRVLRDRH